MLIAILFLNGQSKAKRILKNSTIARPDHLKYFTVEVIEMDKIISAVDKYEGYVMVPPHKNLTYLRTGWITISL